MSLVWKVWGRKLGVGGSGNLWDGGGGVGDGNLPVPAIGTAPTSPREHARSATFTPSTQSRFLRDGIRHAIDLLVLTQYLLLYIFPLEFPLSLLPGETRLLRVIIYRLQVKCHFNRCHHYIFPHPATYIALSFGSSSPVQ